MGRVSNKVREKVWRKVRKIAIAMRDKDNSDGVDRDEYLHNNTHTH